MIEIETRKFVAAMEIAGSVVQRGTSIEVLRQLRLHANGLLSISATDLDMGCEVRLPYSGAPASPFLLPEPARIRKAVAHSGGDSVRVVPGEDGAVSVEAGPLALAAKGVPAGDFPTHGLEALAREDLRCVLGSAEIAAIGRVARAMSAEETRYYLNGIFLHALDDWTVRAVATDGHRLFWANLKIPGAMMARDRFTGVILPRGLINLVLRRFKRAEEVALVVGVPLPFNAVEVAEGTAPARGINPRVALAANLGDLLVSFRSKTIDGTFPDYTRVIPEAHEYRVVLDIATLRRALLSLVASSAAKRPDVTIRHEGGELRCSIATDWGGKDSRACASVVMLECLGLPEGYQIAFNGRYLLDCLNSCRGARAIFGLNGGMAPASIAGDEDAGDFGMVVMPVRT
ncbi:MULTISPECIES: DNA polymerase III subunit beta [Sphingomonas]|uniref:Beta sliding clamp n=1 Tax=Sphingomonas trueperi TaxID=53317 RepID=A0A7X5Y1M6_9SPHN|nr:MULTISPECIES: hypothetical protein [Sphingomonas]NJB99416.1 DNA polymerase-3 subunit beta [Sphingomonas trueperi]